MKAFLGWHAAQKFLLVFLSSMFVLGCGSNTAPKQLASSPSVAPEKPISFNASLSEQVARNTAERWMADIKEPNDWDWTGDYWDQPERYQRFQVALEWQGLFQKNENEYRARVKLNSSWEHFEWAQGKPDWVSKSRQSAGELVFQKDAQGRWVMTGFSDPTALGPITSSIFVPVGAATSKSIGPSSPPTPTQTVVTAPDLTPELAQRTIIEYEDLNLSDGSTLVIGEWSALELVSPTERKIAAVQKADGLILHKAYYFRLNSEHAWELSRMEWRQTGSLEPGTNIDPSVFARQVNFPVPPA